MLVSTTVCFYFENTPILHVPDFKVSVISVYKWLSDRGSRAHAGMLYQTPCSRQWDRIGSFATYIGPRVAAYRPTSNSQDASHPWAPGPQQDATLLPRHEGEQHHWRTGEATVTEIKKLFIYAVNQNRDAGKRWNHFPFPVFFFFFQMKENVLTGNCQILHATLSPSAHWWKLLFPVVQMLRKKKTRHSLNPPQEAHIGWVMDSREHRPRSASIRSACCSCAWFNIKTATTLTLNFLLFWPYSSSNASPSEGAPLSGSYGCTPQSLPKFWHPSHEMLRDNGFTQQGYHKYRRRCLNGA